MSTVPTQPITEDDDAVRAAIDQAAVCALLPAVAALTGEDDLLRDDLRPNPGLVLEPEGGLTEEQLASARALAADALIRFRDRGCPPPEPPTPEQLRRLLGFLVGDDNVDAYSQVLQEELDLDGRDLRAPGWRKDDVAPDRPFAVAIVGAGMSGIVAAHRLQQAGVRYVVFEKNADVGGTWFENTYPGCRVDVPNSLYSYSFAQRVWPQLFSSQDVLLDYFRTCADELGIRPHIRFGTEVCSADWDDDRAVWTLRVRTPDGAEEAHEFQALVSATGQLNQPRLPDIAGRDDFAGPSFHSARWDHDVDLRGTRVAVIGNAASAAQFIPVVAEQAAHLTVFQRTPNWFVPTIDYHDDVPPGMQWLFDHVPAYEQWYRLWLFWRTHEGLLPAAVVDPDWPGQERSVSALNDMVRELLTDYLRTEFADTPELFEKVLPHYPPISKRVIRDNGIWARTLKRPDVDLVTEPIERITPSGVQTADGVVHDVDVLIHATGFRASEFLTPMRITGRDGVELHDRWKGDARAYLGVVVPGYPNLFLMYGPNTNIVINGSIIYFSELEARYLVECVHLMLAQDVRALDVRPEVHDAYNERIDAANRRMAWGTSTVNSWYKNELGRSAQNWPFSLLDYWEASRAPDPDDYELR